MNQFTTVVLIFAASLGFALDGFFGATVGLSVASGAAIASTLYYLYKK